MHYSDFIKSEFEDKKRKNQKYSLRSFARDIGLSSSYLTQILNNNRTLSEERGFQVAKNLKFSHEKSDLFIHLLRIENTKDEQVRAKLSIKTQEKIEANLQAEKISELQFRAIAQWYTGAILELVTLVKGKLSVELLTERFNISPLEATNALKNLQMIGLLKKVNNLFVKSAPFYKVGDIPSIYIKKYHKAMIDKAKKALEVQTFHERYITGVTVAINDNNIKEVFAELQNFRQKMSKLSDMEGCNAIYQLNMQMFRLDEKNASKRP